MQEVFVVWIIETTVLLRWNIVVHDQVDLGHVNAASEDIGWDQSREEALSEIVDDLITFCDLKPANNDFWLNIARLQPLL